MTISTETHRLAEQSQLSEGAATAARHASAWARWAGIAYIAAWLVGLTAFGTGPGSDASESEVARFFSEHRTATAVQSLLVHGIAAIALLVVVVALRRTARSTRAAHLAGLVAVGVSLAQFAFGQWRSLRASGSTISTLVDVINRADGVKMLALATLIAGVVGRARSTGIIGTPLMTVSRLAIPALLISGFAYLTANEVLQPAAVPALVLLLIWVGGMGFALSRDRTAL